MEFANKQKQDKSNDFDVERDKLVIVFDADIFEDKVQGYDELIHEIERMILRQLQIRLLSCF